MQIAKERVDETEKEVKIARENCLYQLKRFIDTYGWDEMARKGSLQVTILHDSNNP